MTELLFFRPKDGCFTHTGSFIGPIFSPTLRTHMTITSADEQGRVRRKRDASRWSLASNGGLLVLKLGVGLVSGSVGVLAEAVHSGADLVGSALAFLSVRASDEPPDQMHAYGHGKIENLSGVATALLILGGGAYAGNEAVRHLLRAAPLSADAAGWAMAVMAVSALLNVVISRRLIRVGRETDSPALVADGHHLRTDVMTSLGVLMGLVLARVTGRPWWDPAAALVVCLLILRVGYGLAVEALRTLSDAALPLSEEIALKAVLTAHPAVLGFHKLRTRKSGSHRHVDVHVQIDDGHSFVEAHRVTEELEDQLRAALPNLHPIIHIEPFDDEVALQREKRRQNMSREP